VLPRHRIAESDAHDNASPAHVMAMLHPTHTPV
jgi:hypothetical protein